VALLCSIARIKGRAVEVLLAELGADMGAWPDARHLCSWAALCPGNNQSGGKQRSGRTRQGNPWLERVLVQAVWAAVRVKHGYLGAQFRRIAKRCGEQWALLAVAHSLLTIVYHVLKQGTPSRNWARPIPTVSTRGARRGTTCAASPNWGTRYRWQRNRRPEHTAEGRSSGKSRGLLRAGSPVSRYRCSHAERATSAIATLCRVLGVARSAYYAWARRGSMRRCGRRASAAPASAWPA